MHFPIPVPPSSNQHDSDKMEEFRIANKGISEACFMFCMVYAEQAWLNDVETMYNRALAGYEKALGPEHTSTLDTANNFGNLYRIQGRFDDAERMYIRALAGFEKAWGPEIGRAHV